MTSSQLQYGDVADDVTSDSVLPWFASDNRSMCGYSCQGNRPDDRLTRVGCQSNSFNDHQVSMQQHPFHCFNQPMDRLSGMDNWTSADYQSHSDSDCSLYSPGVEKTDLNSVRTWAIKQEQFESQVNTLAFFHGRHVAGPAGPTKSQRFESKPRYFTNIFLSIIIQNNKQLLRYFCHCCGMITSQVLFFRISFRLHIL